jgi:hypothetical protein
MPRAVLLWSVDASDRFIAGSSAYIEVLCYLSRRTNSLLLPLRGSASWPRNRKPAPEPAGCGVASAQLCGSLRRLLGLHCHQLWPDSRS